MTTQLKSKIIIRNYSDKSDVEALDLVKEVIKEGRVSNYGKSYCYVTAWTKLGVMVVANNNKQSDTFIVQNTEDALNESETN